MDTPRRLSVSPGFRLIVETVSFVEGLLLTTSLQRSISLRASALAPGADIILLLDARFVTWTSNVLSVWGSLLRVSDAGI
ncbi:hypothetical protein ASE07_21505 [Noviherbaspirillum sp. Root189]|nr:hypothetical protein ASE07_21505 [Noviherbaspirillum sp. Root189]